MSTTKYTLADGTEGVAEVLAPKPSFGIGSKVAVGGVISAGLAFLYAAIDAGSDFYTDNGVVTLFGTFVAATITFFGGRSSQANKLVEQGTQVVRSVNSKMELAIAAYETELAKSDLPVVTQPPAPPVDPVPVDPPVDPAPVDEGGAPNPGTVG